LGHQNLSSANYYLDKQNQMETDYFMFQKKEGVSAQQKIINSFNDLDFFFRV